MISPENEDFETTRYLTKRHLVEANEAAIREKRNKTLSRDFVAGLPDDFIFVVVMEYYHNKYEMRLGITVDFSGKYVLLDVSMARFHSLPVSKTYSDGRVVLELPEDTEKRRPYPAGREWQETFARKPLRRQREFRERVLDAYEFRCAVCDVNIPALLRAAHIVPVASGGDDSIRNGICLCANHEIAFDAGLLRLFPDGSAHLLSNDSGQEFERLMIRFPTDAENHPSADNLARKLDLLQRTGLETGNGIERSS